MVGQCNEADLATGDQDGITSHHTTGGNAVLREGGDRGRRGDPDVHCHAADNDRSVSLVRHNL